MADKFMMNGVKKIPGNFPYNQMYADESKPVNVANSDHTNVSKSFTAVNSDGPWIEPAAKSGSGGTNDFAKISRMADNRDYMVDAGK